MKNNILAFDGEAGSRRQKQDQQQETDFYFNLACQGEIEVPPDVADRMGVFDDPAAANDPEDDAPFYPDGKFPGAVDDETAS